MAKIYWRNGWAWRARRSKEWTDGSPGTRSKEEAKSRFQTFIAQLGKEKTSKWTEKETPFPEAVRVFTEEHLPNLKQSSQERYLEASWSSRRTSSTRRSKTRAARILRCSSLSAVSKASRTAPYVATYRACRASTRSARTSSYATQIRCYPFLRAKKRTKSLVEADTRERHLSHAEELLILTKARENAEAEKAGLSALARKADDPRRARLVSG